ncbi:MAG: hypothetical protein CMH53_00235 [Myxococcales bacterium]|nr:hypothetical protein [Myxococcales bacterium]
MNPLDLPCCPPAHNHRLLVLVLCFSLLSACGDSAGPDDNIAVDVGAVDAQALDTASPPLDSGASAVDIDVAPEPDAPAEDVAAPDTTPTDSDEPDSTQLPDVGPEDSIADAVAPASKLICDPCMANSDCEQTAGDGAFCVSHGPAGAFCGIACQADADCPSDYACEDVTDVDDANAKQCVPIAPAGAAAGSYGACACSADATQKGLKTKCSSSAKDADGKLIGTCSGMRSCGPTGLSECDATVPTDETCNQLDDDCDGQTDEPPCVLPEPECTKGACCDLKSQTFKSAGTKCGEKKSKYGCNASGSLTISTAQPTCSGTDTVCNDNDADLKWSQPIMKQFCKNAFEKCNAEKATCEPIANGCVSGGCCDTKTKTFKAQGQQCSTSPAKWTQKCDGDKIVKSAEHSGCSGKSSKCSSDPADTYVSPWQVVNDCAKNKLVCKTTTPGKPQCTSAQQCTKGTCCDIKTKLFKTKGTSCGASLAKYTCAADGTLSKSTATPTCNGASDACQDSPSKLTWSAAQKVKTCGGSTPVCNAKTGTCDPKPAQCTSGGCCDTKTKTLRLKGSQCTTASDFKWTTKCDGTKVIAAKIYQGCSGKSSTCSSDQLDAYQTPWVTTSNCADSKKVCQQPDPNKFPICVEPPQCKSGACCDPVKKEFKAKGSVCGLNTETKYTCDAKGNVTKASGALTCSGTSTICGAVGSAVKWQPAKLYATCAAGTQTCNASTGKCDTIAGSCSSGGCCDAKNNKLLSKGSKCTTSPDWKVQKCDKDKIVSATRYKGCDGKNSVCSNQSQDDYYTPWKTVQDCGASKGTCAKNGNSYQCQQCTEGTCCNVALKLFKPSSSTCSKSTTKFSCGATGNVMKMVSDAVKCSGTSNQCNSAPADLKWTTTLFKTCKPGEQVCNAKTGTCDAVVNGCASGLCCDLGQKKFKLKGTKCGTKPQYKYQCTGSDLGRATGYANCSGKSAECSSSSDAIGYSGYVSFKKCLATEACNATKGTCDPIPGACTSGGCCDPKTKKVNLKGSKCTTSTPKTVLKCDGNKISESQAFQGCDGKNPTCSTLTTNTYQSPWVVKTDCASSNKVCQQSSPNTSPICAVAQQCKSGQCCDPQTKLFKSKGTKCGAKNQEKYACDAKGNLTVAKGQATCTGASDACSTAEADAIWDKPQTIKLCQAGVSTCNAKTKTCDPIPGGCASGGCCDPATKKVRAQGSKCTTASSSPAKKCGAGKVLTSNRFYGCDGKSSACSKNVADTYYDTWKVQQDCAAENASCVKIGSNYQCQQCSSGLCCETTSKKFSKAGKTCGGLKFKYMCDTNGNLKRASAYPKCSGKSASCSEADADLQWGTFGPFKNCKSNEVCNVKTKSCDVVTGACTPGECCDASTKKHKGKGTQCGGLKVKYQCSGSNLGKATGYGVCTGSSSTCASGTTDVNWSGFVSVKTCAADEVCNAKTGSCDAAPKTCTSGLCCNAATKTIATKGTTCGAKQYKYQCSGSILGRAVGTTACNGASTTCPSGASDISWTGYTSHKVCASGSTCNATTGTCDSNSNSCDVTKDLCCEAKAYEPCENWDTGYWEGEDSTAYKCDNNVVYAQSTFSKMCDGKNSCSKSYASKGWPKEGTVVDAYSKTTYGKLSNTHESAWAKDWPTKGQNKWMKVIGCTTCVDKGSKTPPECLRAEFKIESLKVLKDGEYNHFPGTTFKVQVTVKNIGDTSTKAHKLNLSVLGQNIVFEQKTVTAAGASYTATFPSVKIPDPWTSSSSKISFTVTVDPENVHNASTGGLKKSDSITLVTKKCTGADAAAWVASLSVAATKAPLALKGMQYTATIKNVGKVAAKPLAYLEVKAPNGDWKALNQGHSLDGPSEIKVGASSSAFVQGSKLYSPWPSKPFFSPPKSAGTYSYRLVVDKPICDPNHADNVSAPVTVVWDNGKVPDLTIAITSPKAGTKFQNGKVVSVTAKVTCNAAKGQKCSRHSVAFGSTNKAASAFADKTVEMIAGSSYSVTKVFKWTGGINQKAVASISTCPSNATCNAFTASLYNGKWYLPDGVTTNNSSTLAVLSYTSTKSFTTSKTASLTKDGQDLSVKLSSLPYNPVGSTISVKVQVFGDYGASNEYAKVYVKKSLGGSNWSSSYLGSVGNQSGGDCNKSGKTATWSAQTSYMQGGSLYVDVKNESAVSYKNSCSSGQKAIVTVSYWYYN